MSGSNHDEQTIKICPFSGKECIQGKCALWLEIGVTKAGMSIPQKQSMCAFTALVLVGSSPKVVMAPPQMQMPNLGGLRGL